MRKQFVLIALIILGHFISPKATAQCLDTLPANTIILTSDTTIGTGTVVNSNYLICPGIKVTYAGTQSIFNHYYLEEGSKLTLNSYHYPYLHLKKNAEIKANHSISPASIIMGITADSGAIFTDTMNQWTPTITWCKPLSFSYINLPNGKGCTPSSAKQIPSPSDINIFPNPTNGTIYIEGALENLYMLRIMALTGKIILTIKPSGKIIEIDASDWAKGLYILQIFTSEDKTIIKQFEIR